MPSIFLREPTYITVQQVKDSTSKTGIVSLSDENIKILISKAENTIDDYIGSYGKKFSDTQPLIFPVNVKDVSTIPASITIACLYIVEQVYANGDNIIANKGTEIKSESAGDRSVTYGETFNNAFLGIPKQAELLLNKYKKVFYKSTI